MFQPAGPATFVDFKQVELQVMANLCGCILTPEDPPRLKLLSYKEYDKIDRIALKLFCHATGRYGLPTIELVEYLKELIGGRSAIEIGAGNGDLGRHLGIPMTDSRLQEDPVIRERYLN